MKDLNCAAGTLRNDARYRRVSLESLETGASQQFDNLRGQRPSATVHVLVNLQEDVGSFYAEKVQAHR